MDIKLKKVQFKVISYELFWMFILSMYCLNFMNVGVYIPFLLLPIVFIYLLKSRFNIRFTMTLAVLMAFCIIYALIESIYNLNTKGTILLYLLFPSCLYIVGYKLGNKNHEKMLQYLLLIIISFTAFGFLSVIKTLSIYGDMVTAINSFGGKRLVLNLWGGDFISATGINTSLSFGLAMLPLIFLKDKVLKYQKSVKLITLLCFISSIYCVLLLGNRTGLGIVVIAFLTTTLFTKKFSLKKLYSSLTLVLLFLLLKFLFNQNIFGLRYQWESTILYSRFHSMELTKDPRVEAWKMAFWGLFDNPMGGKQTLLPLNFAHNLWLDVGFEGGIFPLLLLIIFSLVSISIGIKFIKLNHPVILKGFVIALYTSFFITFMVEPILQGWFSYFNIFCFIVGMVQKQNHTALLSK